MYLCVDDATREQFKMDVARILVRTKCFMVLNETFNVKINGNFFNLKVVEDAYGPLRINLLLGWQNHPNSSKLETNSNKWRGEAFEEEESKEEKDDVKLVLGLTE